MQERRREDLVVGARHGCARPHVGRCGRLASGHAPLLAATVAHLPHGFISSPGGRARRSRLSYQHRACRLGNLYVARARRPACLRCMFRPEGAAVRPANGGRCLGSCRSGARGAVEPVRPDACVIARSRGVACAWWCFRQRGNAGRSHWHRCKRLGCGTWPARASYRVHAPHADDRRWLHGDRVGCALDAEPPVVCRLGQIYRSVSLEQLPGVRAGVVLGHARTVQGCPCRRRLPPVVHWSNRLCPRRYPRPPLAPTLWLRPQSSLHVHRSSSRDATSPRRR
mmetsp:Transcript_13138/g.41411  ORF Transcript_13138/g.41411 Transcript_13138/m.41411 type:complete len:282 (-) Transcript_13138:94-939(-)